MGPLVAPTFRAPCYAFAMPRTRPTPLSLRLLLALSLLIPFTADAKLPRSASARADFKRTNPCPSTGDRRGPCPGYMIDHIIPLCADGPDHPANMQWQSSYDAKRKDREERRMCRR